MFDNPILEWGSRVHPIVPPLIYLPVISFLLSVAINAEDLTVSAVAGVFVLGRRVLVVLRVHCCTGSSSTCGPTTTGAGRCTSSSTASITTIRTTRCAS